jgi:DNA-binding transcriptional regulator YhcF (GntR family)
MTLNHDTKLNEELAIPIYQQIYEHLRSAILAGQLRRGTKLPSTRRWRINLAFRAIQSSIPMFSLPPKAI